MLIPARAFVRIDVQQVLLDGDNAIPDAAGLLDRDRLATLVATAHAAQTLIIHLQNDGAVGMSDEPETPGWDIHPKVTPAAG